MVRILKPSPAYRLSPAKSFKASACQGRNPNSDLETIPCAVPPFHLLPLSSQIYIENQIVCSKNRWCFWLRSLAKKIQFSRYLKYPDFSFWFLPLRLGWIYGLITWDQVDLLAQAQAQAGVLDLGALGLAGLAVIYSLHVFTSSAAAGCFETAVARYLADLLALPDHLDRPFNMQSD
ncbi:hypothetical protein C4D60_Mb03t18530 [Musa balbisiana]|uniref:Uncharacterized protein n=1 Tax=Musa balbisiana TaxID=52838 RepID=A0A4S8JB68_MUSBA|nr:hypothetical protein C4D60_Mb03t18530 [Musa balbisiana]